MRDALQRYEGRTIAVTGAGGYLGAALSAALRNTPARRLLVSRRSPPPDAAAGADLLIADLREPVSWRHIVQRADVVFHVAANASVYAAASDPAGCLTSTLLPLTHLVAAAREARRTPRIIYASTSRVYGVVATLPVAEDADSGPVTPFGLHNLMAEQLLAMASQQGAVEAISLRFGNVYGPSPATETSATNVLNKMARLAAHGADLPLYGEGNYRRDYVHIDDVARAFLLAGITPGMTGQSFNVASGHGITVRDILHFIADRGALVTGKRSAVRQVPWPAGETAIEGRDFEADVRRIAAVCGWKATISLTEGIDRLIASR